jgi:two-component system, NarL family, nitrate/nitrite response regulator NarL
MRPQHDGLSPGCPAQGRTIALRIVIADAHRAFAGALGSLLRRSDHKVVGYAVVLDAAAEPVARMQADACVFDADLACEPGALAKAMAVASGTAFVVLADSPESGGLDIALAAGAHGAALKTDDFAEFMRVLNGACVRAARRSAGGAVLSLSAQAARRRISGGLGRPWLAESLTPREREVLARLVRGESTTSMARSMGVRLSTTRTHVDSILIKLGVHSRLEAVAYAVKAGIITVPGGFSGRAGDEWSALSCL